MGAMTLQKIRVALREMEETAAYQALATKPMADEAFHEFWQEVNATTTRCFTSPPNVPVLTDVAERLNRLHRMTTGTLGSFRPFIERAQAALADA